ncbi:MAG: hypothetical protein AAFX39_12400 [Pseudomonadota bacterium]
MIKSRTAVDREAFMRSDDLVVDGSTLDQGKLTFGFQAGTTFLRPDHTTVALEPSIDVNGIWNFATFEDLTVSGAAVIEDPEAFASTTASLAAAFDGGVRAQLSTPCSGLGADVTVVTIGGRLVMPFGD